MAGLNVLSRRYAHLVIIQQLLDMVTRLTFSRDIDSEVARTGEGLGLTSSVLVLGHRVDAAQAVRAQVLRTSWSWSMRV